MAVRTGSGRALSCGALRARRLNIVAEVTGFGDREFYKARPLQR
jgi:hypothetical protein